MKKKRFITFFVFLAFLPAFVPPVFANWVQDDSGIQTFYQDRVPQFTRSGKIQFSYTNDSFFPLGLYHVDIGPVPDANGTSQGQIWNTFHLNDRTSRNTLPELKTAGFNTVMRFVSFAYHGQSKYPVDFTPNEYELNLLDSYGMKAFVEMLGPAMWSVNNYNNWNQDTLRSTITRIKAHTSVLGYHLFDEIPNEFPNTWPMDEGEWKTIHDIIKTVDPDRPVFANANGSTCLPASYNDINSFDRYTKRQEWGGEMNLVDLGQTTSAHRNCLQNLPVIAIIQAQQNITAGKLPPTPQEIRSQYYTVLVNGATGIAAFAQHSPYFWKLDQAYPWDQTVQNDFQGISPQVHADLWAAASQANHEIETWKWVFLARTATNDYHVYFDTIPGGLVSLLKDPGDGARYLLAASQSIAVGQLSAGTHTAMFTFPTNQTIARVTSIFDGTILPVSNNSFSASFGVGDVRFYKIEFTSMNPIRTPSPIPTPSPTPTRLPTPTHTSVPTPSPTPGPEPLYIKIGNILINLIVAFSMGLCLLVRLCK